MKQGLKIIPVAVVEEVLKIALTRQPTPIDWVEAEILPTASLPKDDTDAVVTH